MSTALIPLRVTFWGLNCMGCINKLAFLFSLFTISSWFYSFLFLDSSRTSIFKFISICVKQNNKN